MLNISKLADQHISICEQSSIQQISSVTIKTNSSSNFIQEVKLSTPLCLSSPLLSYSPLYLTQILNTGETLNSSFKQKLQFSQRFEIRDLRFKILD